MEGAIAALREVRQPGDVALVVNELTPESRSALVDRQVVLVIGTPLQQVCRDVMHLMVDAINEGMLRVSGQHFLRPDLFLQESV
jgi:LacI family transcriptional regulator